MPGSIRTDGDHSHRERAELVSDLLEGWTDGKRGVDCMCFFIDRAVASIACVPCLGIST